MSLLERLSNNGPKRILALSGGGIRGLIELGYLARMEKILMERSGKPNFRLCDYFDLIGGTSTGAIIAAALALGYDINKILNLYLDLGKYIFGSKRLKKWVALYSSDPLQKALEKELGDITLGDQEKIKTGLCIITKRADTGSTWPLFNHPSGKYYEENQGMLLRDVIRASAAAPTFFQPVTMEVGNKERGAFVDGGVSMFNNPTMQLFLLAVLKGYPFHWDTGADQLMLVSIGTGVWEERRSVETIERSTILNWAQDIPLSLLKDANLFNQQILQIISHTPTPIYFDSEIGNLQDDLIVPEPLFYYLQYDFRLNEQGMQEIGMADQPYQLQRLRDISAADQSNLLVEIGKRAAEMQVNPDHFPQKFDVTV